MLNWSYRSINHCCIYLVHLYYFTQLTMHGQTKIKKRIGIAAGPKHGANEDDNTQHTRTRARTRTQKQRNKSYNRLNIELPNDYNSLLWLHGPALDQLHKTVALQSLQQTLTARSSHRQSACIHYATLFVQWKCFWRHTIFVFDMFIVDIAQYYHIVQWI